MQNLKEFVVNEIKENLERKIKRKKIMESSKVLFEAVNLSQAVKNDPTKAELSEKAISLAEKKLVEDYNDYDGGCDCGEGEGKMLKAQLLSILSNAQKLLHMIDEDDQFEDWIQSKITIAEDYMRVAYSYMAYYNEGDEVSDDDWADDDMEGMDDEEMEIFYDDEDWVEEEPAVYEPEYMDALSPDVDDDEIFEQVKKKVKNVKK